MVVPISISRLEEIQNVDRAYWRFYLSTLSFSMICLCSFILVSFCFCCSCSKRCMKCGAAKCQCCCNLISLVAEWLLCFLKTSEDPEDEDAICPAAEGRTNNETNTPRSRSSYDVAMVETGQSTNDKSTKNKVTIFIIYKQKAPFCYTIYLLYMVAVLFIHCIFAFFASAVVEPATSNYMYDNCNPDNKTACLEIDLLSGVESLGAVFGFSVTAIAINTYFLLICTCYRYGIHHKRSDGDEDKCCVPCNCKRRVCCCSVLTITIQIIGVVIPRALLYYYEFHYFDVRNAGPFDHQSVFVIVAIMDAISLSCLTPWCCFKKMNRKDPNTEDA